MTPPIRQLNPELIEQHPPIWLFSDFIREKTGQSPPPDRIQVLNDQPQDGFIDLQYAADRQIFLGRLNAHEQLIQLHHGKFLPKKPWPDWGAGPMEIKIPGTCGALHALGGDLESQVNCRDQVPRDRSTEKALWYGGTGLLTLGGLETAWRLKGKGSWTLNFVRSFWQGARLGPGQKPTWWQSTRETSAVGIGLAAMALARPLGDALGLHHRDERHERRALAVGMGYGAYRFSRVFARGFGKKPISPFPAPLGISLMSAALAEGTLGRFWDEGTSPRLWVRDVGFFLPALSRSFQGERQWKWLEQAGWKKFSKWGGRVMAASFLADLGYLAYNHVSLGHAGAVYKNRLYARANQLHEQDAYAVTLLLKGACSFVAPALTERFWVPSEHIRQAQEEMRYQDLRYVTSLEGDLRDQIGRRLAQAGDPQAWERDDFWQWLSREGKLTDLVSPAGNPLPVQAVAEQLADPRVQERLTGKSEAQVLAYLRHQFRGWQLSTQELRSILEEIQAHALRQQLAVLPASADLGLTSLGAHFDAKGRLLPGAGPALVRQLFPEISG